MTSGRGRAVDLSRRRSLRCPHASQTTWWPAPWAKWMAARFAEAAQLQEYLMFIGKMLSFFSPTTRQNYGNVSIPKDRKINLLLFNIFRVTSSALQSWLECVNNSGSFPRILQNPSDNHCKKSDSKHTILFKTLNSQMYFGTPGLVNHRITFRRFYMIKSIKII